MAKKRDNLRKWKILVICVLVAIPLIFVFLYYIYPLYILSEDEFEVYLREIVVGDLQLRKKASAIVWDCPSADKECQVNEIFRHVVENYKYYGDPRRGEFVQSVSDTKEVKGGDCEDLTILLNSLLENIGIKTYLVLTADHAYSLACGLDIDRLQEEILESFRIRQEFYNGIYYPRFTKVDITTVHYEIDDEVCVILDSTIGPLGYPGYDTQILGYKVAIDPVTRKRVVLEKE